MNNNKHHFDKHVFSYQSHTALVQLLPTSGAGTTDRRTTVGGAARPTRINPLTVEKTFDSSRVSTRLPADHTAKRPHAAPTHILLSQQGRGGLLHNGEGPLHQDPVSTTPVSSGTNSKRPDAQAYTPPAGRFADRGALIDSNNSRKCLTHVERPRGGVGQDKGVLTNALLASQEPAPLEKAGRAHVVNKDSPRSQNTPRANSLSNARVKLVHTTFWLHPLVRAD
jgi:hypothetical protein